MTMSEEHSCNRGGDLGPIAKSRVPKCTFKAVLKIFKDYLIMVKLVKFRLGMICGLPGINMC